MAEESVEDGLISADMSVLTDQMMTNLTDEQNEQENNLKNKEIAVKREEIIDLTAEEDNVSDSRPSVPPKRQKMTIKANKPAPGGKRTTELKTRQDIVPQSVQSIEPEECFKCTFIGCTVMCASKAAVDRHFANAHKDTTELTKLVERSIKVFRCTVNGCSQYNTAYDYIKKHIDTFHHDSDHTDDTQPKPVDLMCGQHVIPCTNSANSAHKQPVPQSIVPKVIAYRCRVKGCHHMSRTEPSIKSHVVIDHQISAEECDAYKCRISVAQDSVQLNSEEVLSKQVNRERLKEYVRTQMKEHFIPNSSFANKAPICAQARELIINFKHYFELRHPEWNQTRLISEINKVTKISDKSIYRIIESFRQHKKIVGPKMPDYRDRSQFKCTDEDRDVLLQCIYKLKDEGRLKYAQQVFNEINRSDIFNPSFKGCMSATFNRIFRKTGLKIKKHMIINKKADLIEKEKKYRISPLESSSGHWECGWPGCKKTCKIRENLIEHIRCHTDDKPYECIVPMCGYKCRTAANIANHRRSRHIN